jgi:hypothetical protein
MDISQEQAEKSLSDIQEMMKRTRRKVSAGSGSLILIMWGMIWVVGFLSTQFLPKYSGWIWLVLDLGGVGGSILAGYMSSYRNPPVKHSDGKRLFWQIFFFWFILFGYIDIWIVILWPVKPEQMIAFGCTVIMLAYVIVGLFFERFMLWLGLAVTALILLGYFLFLFGIFHWFWVWMAFAGGGTLAGTGLYIRYRWR